MTSKKTKYSDTDVAIVGMSACFSRAPDMNTYWSNILNKVDAVHEADDAWAAPYFDPDSKANDRIYTRRGGFLGELANFNPAEFGIMPNAVDGGEPDQYLALKLARDAIRDAGYEDRSFNRQKTGVILGRGTYVNRGYTNLMQHGLVVDQTMQVLGDLLPDLDPVMAGRLRQNLIDKLPPFNSDMCPGLVPNVVTGRIANRLDLMGPNFIIDAACASSLIAVELSIRELMSGRCDMVLTGGIHVSTPPQILMIFCQLGGLSRGDIRPFDAGASGTLLGEGAGIMVFKRLADAVRDDDRIYSVVRGVGTSSDGKALGLLAPRLEGEVLAVQRAYESCNVDPDSVGLIEAHGTGIPLGDQTEIRALRTVFGERRGDIPDIAVGSVKSMISHCIPAAGAAGLIKSSLALKNQVLPPMLCDEVNPELDIEATRFYLNTEARPWVHPTGGSPRRAGVNAFGFGGVNAHAVLEEYRSNSEAFHAPRKNADSSAYLFPISAASPAALGDTVTALVARLAEPGAPGASELAAELCALPVLSQRLAVVAANVPRLVKSLKRWLQRGAAEQKTLLTGRGNTFFGRDAVPGKVAWLFPGEGSQYPNMLAGLCTRFPLMQRRFDLLADACAQRQGIRAGNAVFPPPNALTDEQSDRLDAALFDMDIGSETVFTASMAFSDQLHQLGVPADMMMGHSTGENSALVASGMVQFSDDMEMVNAMRSFNQVYCELLAAGDIETGSLLTVGALDRASLDAVLAEFDGEVVVAMDNCANQVVLYGQPQVMARVQDKLAAVGGLCVPLPFDRAYHTPGFAPVSKAFRPVYDSLPLQAPRVPVYSCAIADVFPSAPDDMRDTAATQWQQQVRFRQTIEKMYADGCRVFLEVGPGSNLTSFCRDVLRDRDCLILGSNSRRQNDSVQFLRTLGSLFAAGYEPDLAQLNPVVERTVKAEKPGMPLHLHLPRLRIDEDLAAEVRRTYAQKVAGKQNAPAEHADAEPAPVMTRPEPVVARTAPEPVDPRLGMLNGHLSLMQSFLASQKNVMAMLQSGGVVQNGAGNGVATQVNAGANGLATARDVPAPAAPPVASPPADERSFCMPGAVIASGEDGTVFERLISLKSDPYLLDHTLGRQTSVLQSGQHGLPVIPFTFSMELLAQAALTVAGKGVVRSMQDLRGYRWLSLDTDNLTLQTRVTETTAENSARRFTVRVYQVHDSAKPGVLVFEGGVLVAADHLAAPPTALQPLDDARPSTLDDDVLYSGGMFHGPGLQGVTHLQCWSKEGIDADLVTLPTTQFFSADLPAALATDAGLLDAAGQLVGYWLSQTSGSDFNCFPFQVKAFHQYSGLLPPGSRVQCSARIRFLDDKKIEAHFEIKDSSGAVIAILDGWQDRYFDMPERYYACRLHPCTDFLSREELLPGSEVVVRRIEPLPDGFLDDGWAIWKRVLAHLVLTREERDEWQALPGTAARSTEWLLGRVALKDAVRVWLQQHGQVLLAPADIRIQRADNGKPFASVPGDPNIELPEVSLTHSQGHVAAAATQPGHLLGIDLELSTDINLDDLQRAGAFSSNELQKINSKPGYAAMDQAVVIWSAKEAAAKAMGTGLVGEAREWRVDQFSEDQTSAVVQHGNHAMRVRLTHSTGTVAVCDLPATKNNDRSAQNPTPAQGHQ